jgi:hypothetical protein
MGLSLGMIVRGVGFGRVGRLPTRMKHCGNMVGKVAHPSLASGYCFFYSHNFFIKYFEFSWLLIIRV